MIHDDPRAEIAALTAALGAFVDAARLSGATGLPAVDRTLARERTSAPSPAGESTHSSRSGQARPGGPQPENAESTSGPAADRMPRAPHEPGVAAALPASEVARRLEVLQQEVAGCTRCPLHEGRTQTVFARGTGTSGLCFVGEGPGVDEDAQGFPFVGKAGQLLDRMIAAMGFSRDEVYVCNIVKCRPPKNRKPEPSEMAACRPYLVEQLRLIEPQVIVALGATAVEGLLGIGGGITRLRGNWRLYDGRIAVMPTFHPAYLLRQPAAKRDVWNDLQEVLRHMGHTIPTRET